MSSVSELRYFIKSSGCRAIFTCPSLLATTLKAASTCGIPGSHIFIIEENTLGDTTQKSGEQRILTLDELISLGRNTPPLQSVEWTNKEGENRAAFLSWSSGTSGVPVGEEYSTPLIEVVQNC